MSDKADNLVAIGATLIAERRFSLEKLQAKSGIGSRRTVYQYLRKCLAQIGRGSVKKVNAYQAVVDCTTRQSWRRFVELLDEQEKTYSHHPVKLLKAFVREGIGYLVKRPSFVVLLARETPSWTKKGKFDSLQLSLWSRLLTIICRAQAEGLIDPRLDPDLCLRLLYGSVEQGVFGLAIRSWVNSNESYTPEQLIAGIERLLDGLVPRGVEKTSAVARARAGFSSFAQRMEWGISGLDH